jgi:hypothetical protein
LKKYGAGYEGKIREGDTSHSKMHAQYVASKPMTDKQKVEESSKELGCSKHGHLEIPYQK